MNVNSLSILTEDEGSMVCYDDGVTRVELGDQVELRGGFVLLFKKLVGRVVYVPGISPLNPEMEFNGLQWVAVDIQGKALLKTLVDPDTKRLVHKIKLLGRRASRSDTFSSVPLGTESDN